MYPKVTEERLAATSRYWANLRSKHLEHATVRGNDNGLDASIESSISAIRGRSRLSYDPPQLLDFDLHNHWATVILAAQSYNADNPKQDTLVYQVLNARQIGSLVRENIHSDDGSPVLARTSNGQKIWADLPFLQEDLVRFWCVESLELPMDKRTNLSAFIARLIGVGIGGLSLSGCVVSLFRNALEIPRRLTSADDGSEASVEDLLPAIDVFVFIIRYQLGQIIETAFDSFDEEILKICSPGELAIAADIHDIGFSLKRWTLWKTRLAEIAQSGMVSKASDLLSLINNIEY